MITIDGVEALDNALIQAFDKETEGLFEQGDIVVEAIARGMDEKLVYGRFNYLSKVRSRKTVERRRKVSTIFTPDCRNPELNWFIHSICAEAAKLHEPETFVVARQWLDIAADGYMTPDGKQHEHTAGTLKRQMRAAGLNPEVAKDIYLFEGEGCLVKVLSYYEQCTIIQIEIVGQVLLDLPTPMDNVYVTLAQKVTGK